MASSESKSQLAKLKKVFTSLSQQAEIQKSLLICITTSIDKKSSQLSISISDYGIGISQEIKEKIFEPFLLQKKPGRALGWDFQ